MYKNIILTGAALLMMFSSCKQNNHDKLSESVSTTQEIPFLWENANLYFLLTDRFNNAEELENHKKILSYL